MNKLIVVIMGQNCEKFIPMCMESVKSADQIIYCDGGSTDKTQEKVISSAYDIIDKYNKAPVIIIENNYDQEDLGMNGRQRNFYLQYLRYHHPEDWALCLDADEVVEDLDKIKEFIQEAQPGVYHPRMRHFIGDLSKEDATTPEHFALGRLFKISEALGYPEVEHPVLRCGFNAYYRGTTIWHLGYVNGIFDVKKKYDNHKKKSNMHSLDYLYHWNMSHILGNFPTKLVNVLEIPRVILDNFNIEKDVFYFANRGLTIHNFMMTKDWVAYFNPNSVLDLGCGFGNYGFVFKNIYGIKWTGLELSEYAVKLNPYGLDIKQGDIRNFKDANRYELVLCVDILEHLDEKDLNIALDNIKYMGDNFLFSIPFIGDPNLENDATHKLKQTKEWWINKLSQYFDIRDTPEKWAFSNQILIGKRK